MKLLICLLVLLSLLFFLILLLVLRRLYHLHLECLRLQTVLAQQDDYRTQALTDVLTGLPNRRSLTYRVMWRGTICSVRWHSACATPAPPMCMPSGWGATNLS